MHARGHTASRGALIYVAGLALAAALPATAAGQQAAGPPAAPAIRADALRAHLRYLASPLLEGRAPGTRGGDLAAHYIAAQFERAGLQPVRGSYFQAVPLAGIALDPRRSSVSFRLAGERLDVAYPDELVVWLPGGRDSVDVTGELVFAGYGVRAPEYDWDDYAGRDVRGRIVLVLVNDPPAPPEEPDLFGGRAMSYYGRWTYKLEEARRQGAAGAILVHTAPSAGYPWSVVENSWTGEQLALTDPAGDRLALQAWLGAEAAGRLLAAAGRSLEELQVLAARRDFRPVATGISVRASLRGRMRAVSAANVVGLVPGRHPERRNEVVIYTAHYDHLGIGRPVNGDSIYHGAYDNASGVAVLIEIAEAFAALPTAPGRSVLFIATTAEEAGLLGATHYARNPLFPLERTMAAINIDGANLWGETDDMLILGGERSTLGRLAAEQATRMGLRLIEDTAPEKGFYYRSDHFPFARAGVPAVAVEHGLSFRGRPPGWGAALLERYEAERYHQPADRFHPTFDLAGAAQQAALAFRLGHAIAASADVPEWYPGGEFQRR
jgi:Zn-dependent M28 family amino/carboxypeptidase